MHGAGTNHRSEVLRAGDESPIGGLTRPTLHIMIRPAAAEVTAQLDHFAPRIPVLVELALGDVPVVAPIIHARGLR